jgi:hypothetical protein
VLRSFNTRAFKREQPDNPDLMRRVISQSMSRHEPVSFVLYWGKGPRTVPGEPEAQTLDYLAALALRVREAYELGATITVIFTDTHAELNGHSQQSIRAYFDEIAVAAHQRGFNNCWLGQLVRDVVVAPEENLGSQEVPSELWFTLCASAKKWFTGDGTAEQGALRYYRLNMLEKRAVELTFPCSIFVTFSGSGLRALFPSRLPIFYMFSIRHGVSDKPWFLPAILTVPRAYSNMHQLAVHS